MPNTLKVSRKSGWLFKSGWLEVSFAVRTAKLKRKVNKDPSSYKA